MAPWWQAPAAITGALTGTLALGLSVATAVSQRKSARRAQAARVVISRSPVVPEDVPESLRSYRSGDRGLPWCRLVLTNSSELPIYDVKLDVLGPFGIRDPFYGFPSQSIP